MTVLILTALVAAVLMGLSILAMAIGLLLRGRIMRGGCGTAGDPSGKVVECEACSKKQLNLCEEDGNIGLADASFAATFGRFQRKSKH